MATFHIIYPAGARSKLKVLELSSSASHELNDYALASRIEFESHDQATTHAKELCKAHLKEFVPDDSADKQHDFLD